MIQEVKISNGTVSYYSLGKGLPLIMLNGYGGNFYMWPKGLKEELSKHFKVFFLNYREIGYSSSRDGNYTIPLLTEDVHQFIHALKLTNVSLLGFSMGGFVAQEFALTYKEHINLLILCATKTGGNKAIPADPEIGKLLVSNNLRGQERINLGLKLNFPEEVHHKFLEQQRERIIFSTLPEGMISPETQQRQSQANSLWVHNFPQEKYAEYEKIKARKTLIFSGMKDLIIPYQNSIVLCEHIKNSKIILFNNGGHGLLSQYSIEIARDIVTNLDEKYNLTEFEQSQPM